MNLKWNHWQRSSGGVVRRGPGSESSALRSPTPAPALSPPGVPRRVAGPGPALPPDPSPRPAPARPIDVADGWLWDKQWLAFLLKGQEGQFKHAPGNCPP